MIRNGTSWDLEASHDPGSPNTLIDIRCKFPGFFFRWFINGYMIAVCNNYNSGKVHDVYMSGKIDFIKATTYDLGQR